MCVEDENKIEKRRENKNRVLLLVLTSYDISLQKQTNKQNKNNLNGSR